MQWVIKNEQSFIRTIFNHLFFEPQDSLLSKSCATMLLTVTPARNLIL